MKQNFLVKTASWMMAHVAWITMTISPVALGKESEKLSTQYFKDAIIDLQLNKKMTLQEFWEKTKADYPGYAYYEIEQLVKSNPNALVPQFQVKSAKGSDGIEVPVLTYTESGKTHTIQIYGDVKRYLTFDGVNISATEAAQPEKVFQKLLDHDAKLEKQYIDEINQQALREAKDVKKATKQGRFSTFTGFPRVTPQMWASMSPFDRAQYLVLMRTMWQDARKVNFYSEQNRLPSSDKKAPKKKTSSLENIYKLFLGQDAHAQKLPPCKAGEVRAYPKDSDPSKATCKTKAALAKLGDTYVIVGAAPVPVATKPTPTPTPGSVVTKPTPTDRPDLSNDNTLKCINAGWVTVDDGRECSYNKVVESLGKEKESFKGKVSNAVFSECGKRNFKRGLACNPLIYGYQKDGGALCYEGDPRSRPDDLANDPQRATFFDGPCDKQAKLTTKALTNTIRDDKKYTGKAADELAAVEENQKNDPNGAYALTKQFLASTLARENKYGKDEIAKILNGTAKWNSSVDDFLVQIQDQFAKDISAAIKSCEADTFKKGHHDPNQAGACDQLHRRWLFTEQFISKYRKTACPEETQYLFDFDVNNGLTDKKNKNLTSVKDINEDSKNLPCGCYEVTPDNQGAAPTLAKTGKDNQEKLAAVKDFNGKKILARFPIGYTDLADVQKKCGGAITPPVVGDACADIAGKVTNLDKVKTVNGVCVCESTNKPPQPKDGELGEHSNVEYSCGGGEKPIAEKCDKYPPLNTSGKLNDKCECVDKKGKVKGMPKKINNDVVGWFTSYGKKSDKVGADGKPQENGKGDRYTCDKGPNWWKIIGVGVGVAALIALLKHKKKKCPAGTTGAYPNCQSPPNTCPVGTTGVYPNCVNQCTPPKQLIDNECVCNVRCAPNTTMNPVTCVCSPDPSEGGDGDPTCNPAVDPNCGYGGTGQ